MSFLGLKVKEGREALNGANERKRTRACRVRIDIDLRVFSMLGQELGCDPWMQYAIGAQAVCLLSHGIIYTEGGDIYSMEETTFERNDETR